ncbi:MAG: transporter family protein [Mycobacterium sp.]|jgi:branched-chain amino acid transport system ATP-binding protein|nr:transporter family protein [Mycobacterium sp.]
MDSPQGRPDGEVELAVSSITKKFGGLMALDDVSFAVRQRETFGVIGPNGAGKTTLLNVVSGSYPPDGGEVHHRGKPITGKPLRTVVEQGIVRTFQLTTVFPEMTVLENIAVGCHLRHRPSFVGEICSSPRARRAAGNEERLARDIAESVGLQAHQHDRTGLLPYGLKKALSIGIILATDPKVVLLDEPVAGMNRREIDLMLTNITALTARGITVVVVEHNMPFIMNICDRVLVLNFGRVLAQGPPAHVRNDPAVIDAYLGAAP